MKKRLLNDLAMGIFSAYFTATIGYLISTNPPLFRTVFEYFVQFVLMVTVGVLSLAPLFWATVWLSSQYPLPQNSADKQQSAEPEETTNPPGEPS